MKLTKIISLILCVALFIGCLSLNSYAATKEENQQKLEQLQQQAAEIQSNINSLKSQKNEKQKLKDALDEKIAVLQQKINICNDEIDRNNAIIAENEAVIAEKNEEMEQKIFDFKKRIRTIHMSNSTAGGLEILLGADSFSDFIALSQLTQNVSKRDKKMVNEIVEEIQVIEDKMSENKELIAKQEEIKADLKADQDELDKDAQEIKAIINGIQLSVEEAAAEQRELDNQMNEVLAALGQGAVNSGPFSGVFTWPVPGFTDRTSEYGTRWNSKHAGIDIAQGGIAGARVVAAASGTVTVGCSTCTHDYDKERPDGSVWSCGCGGGYGNYLVIDHGIYGGMHYRTVYAHLRTGSVSVYSGQYVGAGTMVGRVGTTGRSTGPHLHFEIRRGYDKDHLEAKNPMDFF